MKIKESELKNLIREALESQMDSQKKAQEVKTSLNESGNFMSRRELLNKARDASFKFEAEIIKTLELEDPNMMDRQHRKEFLTIVRKMEKGIVKAVAQAIVDSIQARIPTKKDDVETEPKKVDKDHPETTPVSVTPHNRVPGNNNPGGL